MRLWLFAPAVDAAWVAVGNVLSTLPIAPRAAYRTVSAAVSVFNVRLRDTRISSMLAHVGTRKITGNSNN